MQKPPQHRNSPAAVDHTGGLKFELTDKGRKLFGAHLASTSRSVVHSPSVPHSSRSNRSTENFDADHYLKTNLRNENNDQDSYFIFTQSSPARLQFRGNRPNTGRFYQNSKFSPNHSSPCYNQNPHNVHSFNESSQDNQTPKHYYKKNSGKDFLSKNSVYHQNTIDNGMSASVYDLFNHHSQPSTMTDECSRTHINNSNIMQNSLNSTIKNLSTLLDKSSGSSVPQRFKEIETNEEVLARRTKQISYGKNTSEYKTYRQQVPKSQRLPNQPTTPYKYQVCSRRSFDAQIKLWRIGLHHYHETTVDLEELMAPKI